MKSSARGLPALLRYVEFDLATPERRAFRAHLQRVACALREIERADDGEPTGSHDAQAIRDCLRDACAALAALPAMDQAGAG
jgi:hypothetical protein